ncbi:MAG: hypothetical protein ACF8QF_12940, partial [Phycisphaerales bacterium]
GPGPPPPPPAGAGHTILAIDSDADAVAACARSGLAARCADFLDPALDLAIDGSPPDAALVLGHTFMLLDDPLDALAFLRRLGQALAPGGLIVLDNFCDALWREVQDGGWQEGVSEDGSLQIVWAPGEPVFTLRAGGAVDPDCWTIRPGEQQMRLYSTGELRLLGAGAGLAGPENDPSGALCCFRTSPSGPGRA